MANVATQPQGFNFIILTYIILTYNFNVLFQLNPVVNIINWGLSKWLKMALRDSEKYIWTKMREPATQYTKLRVILLSFRPKSWNSRQLTVIVHRFSGILAFVAAIYC